MTKALRIESCVRCPFIRMVTGDIGWCGLECRNKQMSVYEDIPAWCPLTDLRAYPDMLETKLREANARIAELEAQVSAWPHIPEADEERDEAAVLEVVR